MFFFFQAEDGIRDLVRSRGLGDVFKRQSYGPGLRKVERGLDVVRWWNQRTAEVHVQRAVVSLSLIHI